MHEAITEVTPLLREHGLSPNFQLLPSNYQVMYHTPYSTTHDYSCFFLINVLEPLSITQGMSFDVFDVFDVNGERVGILSVEQRKTDVQAVGDGSAGRNSSTIGHCAQHDVRQAIKSSATQRSLFTP